MRLGDAAEINPREEIARGSTMPFIEMANVAAGCGGVQRVTSKAFTGGGARFRAGDTLVARITPCLENGKIAVVPPLDAEVGFGSTEFIVLRGDGETTLSPFVRYLAMTPEFREYAEQNLTGSSGRQRVSADIIAEYHFPVPPLEEQKRIADVLGAFDNLIETNQRVAASAVALSREIYLEALIGAPRVPFNDVFDIFGGGTPKTSRPEYWNGTIPWFAMADLPPSDQAWVTDTGKKVTEKGITESSARVLPPETVILTARGTVGEVALTAVPMAMNQSCYGIRTSMTPHGFYALFAVEALADTLKARAGGSVFDTITRNTLTGLEVPLLPDGKIQKIDAKVLPLMAAARELLEESNDLTHQRDELLPLLMSGQASVRDLEAVA